MKYRHHGKHHRRHHRKHHIPRPLVTSKQYCRITCRSAYEFNSNSVLPGETTYKVGVSWQQPGGIIADTYGFDFSGSQWGVCYKNWEEYAITGVRIDFVPCQPNSGTLQTINNGQYTFATILQLNDIWTFDDPNTFAPTSLTTANVLNRKDTKNHPVNRKWHIYKDARPFSATQNVAW